jgi:hypothetical protein
MELGKLLVYLFVLTIAGSPEQAREFASIRGDWTVVRAETRGKPAPAGQYPKEVRFLSASEPVKQAEDAVAFSGRLNPDNSPKRLELTAITIMVPRRPPMNGARPSRATAAVKMPLMAIKQPHLSTATYRVTGDTMKLLIKPGSGPGSGVSSAFVTTKDGSELLLELRRKGAAKPAVLPQSRPYHGSPRR